MLLLCYSCRIVWAAVTWRSKKWVRELEEDRAELALSCGRARHRELGRALQSLRPSSTLLASQQIWEIFLEEARKFLQQKEMKIFRNFSSVRWTFFLFLSLSFLNGICCLNISLLLSPFLFCSYLKAGISLKRFIAIENRRQKSHWWFQTTKENLKKKVIKVKSWKLFILQGKKSVSKSQFNFSCRVDYPAPMNRQSVLLYLPLCTYF